MNTRDEIAADLLRRCENSPQDVQDTLIGYSTDHRMIEIRHLSTILLSRLLPATIPAPAVAGIVAFLRSFWLGQQISYYDWYGEAADGDLEQDSVLVLAGLPSGTADAAIPLLVEHFDGDRQFYECGHALLAPAFPRRRTRVVASEITEIQKSVLSALLRNEPIWESDGDLPIDLADRGLPQSRAGVDALQ